MQRFLLWIIVGLLAALPLLILCRTSHEVTFEFVRDFFSNGECRLCATGPCPDPPGVVARQWVDRLLP